jgi:plastocyanin
MNNTTLIGLVTLVLVVLVFGYVLFGRGVTTQAPTASPTATQNITFSPSPGSQTGETKEITVTGREFVFTPSTITVNQGDNVVITFKNMGTVPHNLTIEELNLSTNTISPGQSDTLEFTADQAGTYMVFCTVNGHADRGMQGTLEVK